MKLKAQIKVTKYEKSFSGPDKPIQRKDTAKELIVDEGSIIDGNGDILTDEHDAELGAYVVVDKVTPDEIKLTAYGFPDQSNSALVDLDENKKEQYLSMGKFQQRSLNISLLGGSTSLTIMFIGIIK